MAKKAGLTKAEERFVAEYLKDGNASAAYRLAFPQSRKWKENAVHTKASALLGKGEIQVRISALRQKLAERTEVDLERVVKEVAALALSDPLAQILNEDGSFKPVHEWPELARRSVSSIEVDEIRAGELGVIGYTKKVKFWDKNSSLEKLMKHFGGYEKDNEQKNPFRNLPREQLRELERLISELESQPVAGGPNPPAHAGTAPGLTH